MILNVFLRSGPLDICQRLFFLSTCCFSAQVAICFCFRGGRTMSLVHVLKRFRMRHREVLGTFGAPMAANNSLLLFCGCFRISFFKRVSLCRVSDKHPRVFPLSVRVLHALGFETNFLIVRWSLARVLDISSVVFPSLSIWTIFVISSSLKNALRAMLHKIWNGGKETVSPKWLPDVY